jgi:hypothetical protein
VVYLRVQELDDKVLVCPTDHDRKDDDRAHLRLETCMCVLNLISKHVHT